MGKKKKKKKKLKNFTSLKKKITIFKKTLERIK